MERTGGVERLSLGASGFFRFRPLVAEGERFDLSQD
jgi:hypothetical protein